MSAMSDAKRMLEPTHSPTWQMQDCEQVLLGIYGWPALSRACPAPVNACSQAVSQAGFWGLSLNIEIGKEPLPCLSMRQILCHALETLH